MKQITEEEEEERWKGRRRTVPFASRGEVSWELLLLLLLVVLLLWRLEGLEAGGRGARTKREDTCSNTHRK